MINARILEKLKEQVGYEKTEVSPEDIKLASAIALLSEQEALKKIVGLCSKHPTASAGWVAKTIAQHWEQDDDLDDGKEAPRIVIPGR